MQVSPSLLDGTRLPIWSDKVTSWVEIPPLALMVLDKRKPLIFNIYNKILLRMIPKKEIEGLVLGLLKKGLSYKEISLELKNVFGVEKTVGSVRSLCFRKGERSSTYYKDSKILTKCLNCGCDILDLKCHNRKFCSKYCSGSFNNSNKEKGHWRKKKDVECLNCGKMVRFKYCNPNCQRSYERRSIFSRIENGEIFSSNICKTYLINKYGDKCMECGWCEVNKKTGKIPINLEHVDGDSSNNRLENLKLLCPNCHSLTETYGSLNKGRGRSERQNYRNYIKKMELSELINELSIIKGENIREKKEKEISKFNKIEYYKGNMKIKNRPSLEELLKSIKSLGYRGTGDLYGVTDACIKNWIEKYKKYGNDWLN